MPYAPKEVKGDNLYLDSHGGFLGSRLGMLGPFVACSSTRVSASYIKGSIDQGTSGRRYGQFKENGRELPYFLSDSPFSGKPRDLEHWS